MYPMLLLTCGAFGPRTFLDKDADGGTGDEADEKKPIPYAEHRKVRQALKTANEKIAEFERRAPDVAKVAAERDAARAELADLGFRYSADTSLLGLGMNDADDRAFVRDRYNSSGEPGKEKPAFDEWVKTVGEKRWFKAMLPEQAPGADGGDEAARSEYAANKGKAPEQGAGKGDEKKPEQGRQGAPRTEPDKKPAFNPNAGTRGNSAPGGARPAFTREEIAGMSPDEYRTNRDAIRDAQRAGRIE